MTICACMGFVLWYTDIDADGFLRDVCYCGHRRIEHSQGGKGLCLGEVIEG